MKPDQSFLLMKHRDRYDLPKGHMELGETEQQTGLRGKSMNRLQDNINIRSLNPT